MIIIKAIGAFILTFSFFYLLGSFNNADFNLTHWSDSSRLNVTIYGGYLSFIVSIATYFQNK